MCEVKRSHCAWPGRRRLRETMVPLTLVRGPRPTAHAGPQTNNMEGWKNLTNKQPLLFSLLPRCSLALFFLLKETWVGGWVSGGCGSRHDGWVDSARKSGCPAGVVVTSPFGGFAQNLMGSWVIETISSAFSGWQSFLLVILLLRAQLWVVRAWGLVLGRGEAWCRGTGGLQRPGRFMLLLQCGLRVGRWQLRKQRSNKSHPSLPCFSPSLFLFYLWIHSLPSACTGSPLSTSPQQLSAQDWT